MSWVRKFRLKLTEEKRNPETKFFTLVPVAQEESHRRELTPLKEPKQDTGDDERPERMNETSAHADNAPAESDCRDDPVELEPLDEKRRGKL